MAAGPPPDRQRQDEKDRHNDIVDIGPEILRNGHSALKLVEGLHCPITTRAHRQRVLRQKVLVNLCMTDGCLIETAGCHHPADKNRRSFADEAAGFRETEALLPKFTQNCRCHRLYIRRAVDQGPIQIEDDVHMRFPGK